MDSLEHNGLPRINQPAPDFVASSTQGPLRLSDYRGKWVVLFSHPSDFTPVCTTEFMALEEAVREFAVRNTQLIGLSVDSLSSHLAWVQAIQNELGVSISFPIISDLTMEVARLYGMIHPDDNSTATVRAVFFIDDEGMIRAIVYYPLSLGRNIQEMIRVIDGLQFTKLSGLPTPANWVPGEHAVYPAPVTADDVNSRVEGRAVGFKAWWLQTTEE